VVADLDRVDAGSFTFRYPTDKKGDRSLPTDVEHINVRHVCERMQSIATFLDGIGEVLHAELVGRHELDGAG